MYSRADGQLSSSTLALSSSVTGLQQTGLARPPPLLAPASRGQVPDRAFPCVKLRGIPYETVEDEIPGWLGIEAVDILFVKQQERFIGDAFVVLANQAEVDLALSKSRTYLGRRYVEVFRASKLDYYKSVTHEVLSNHPFPREPAPQRRRDPVLLAPGYVPEGQATNVLKLRGLPWAARKHDIVNWFSNLPIQQLTTERVHIVLEGGRPTGVAYVDFFSAADAQCALSKDRHTLGDRYVEVFLSNRDEAARYITSPSHTGQQA